ncbi:MAG: uvrC [Burkholderiales bacterium]|nr:uvrC [Burkholderiales bacterium]
MAKILKAEEYVLLPEHPGVYRFYDKYKNLLYIGKAKSLRKRVKSYFSSSIVNKKTKQLASQIQFIEYTLTVDEEAALTLENNLIQILSPQFNILVRKEDSFPIIEISKDKFPQIKLTKLSKAKSNIYGPFISKNDAILKLNFIKKIFKLRTCEQKSFINRTSPCFSYQIKECSAPCIGKISSNEYESNLAKAISFLKGEYLDIYEILEQEMFMDAKSYLFENTAIKRDALKVLDKLDKNRLEPDLSTESFDILLLKQTRSNIFIYISIIRSGIQVGDSHYINRRQKDIPSFLANYIKTRYLKNFNITQVYINIELTQELKGMVENSTNINILLTKDFLSQSMIKLNQRALCNLDLLIDNYSYQNLYLGGILSIKERFKLSNHINIKYVNLCNNFSVFISSENIAKAKILRTGCISLKKHLSKQDKIIDILFIKAWDKQEKELIQALSDLKPGFIILLIKPINHGKDVILELDKSFMYNSENIIKNNGIEKLVRLLEKFY